MKKCVWFYMISMGLSLSAFAQTALSNSFFVCQNKEKQITAKITVSEKFARFIGFPTDSNYLLLNEVQYPDTTSTPEKTLVYKGIDGGYLGTLYLEFNPQKLYAFVYKTYPNRYTYTIGTLRCEALRTTF